MFDSLNIFKKPENSQLSESLDQLSKDYLSSSASKKIREAIDLAGGYQEFAAKSQVYVIKANGLVVRANRNVFKGADRTLGPGDSIIVPRRIASSTEGIDSLVPLTVILFNLAFSERSYEFSTFRRL